MKKSIKTVCKNCKAILPYKAVILKEIGKPHKVKVGAYCEQCGRKLISE